MTLEQILPWVLLLSIVAFAAWWNFRPSARSRKTDFRVITASAVLVLMTGGFIFWQSGFRSAGTLDWEELDREGFDPRSEYRVAFQEALQPAIDYVLLEDFGIVTTTPLLLSEGELKELRDLMWSQMESRFGEAPPEMASSEPDLANPDEGDGGPSLQSQPPPEFNENKNQECWNANEGGNPAQFYCRDAQNKCCKMRTDTNRQCWTLNMINGQCQVVRPPQQSENDSYQ